MAQLDNLLALFLMGKSNMQNMGKRCPSCQDKEGNLFILPTRLSIAGGTTAGDIPALPPFVHNKVKNLPITDSQYCLQMLREGYLYVLEHRTTGKVWRAFSSSPQGCLIEHRDIEKVSHIPKTYTCNIALDGADASYISFKESENIIKLYFIFSPDKIMTSKLEFYQDDGLHLLDGMTPAELRSGTQSLLPENFSPQILEFAVAESLAIQEDLFYNVSPNNGYEERGKIIDKKHKIRELYKNRTLFCDEMLLKHGQFIDDNFKRYLSLYKKLKERQGVAIVVNDAIGITQSLNNRRHEALQREMKPWLEKKDQDNISNEYRLIVLNQLTSFKKLFREKRLRQIKDDKSTYDIAVWGNDKLQIASNKQQQKNAVIDANRLHNDVKAGLYTEAVSEEEFKNNYWDRLSQSKIDNFQDEFDKRSKHAEDLADKRSQDLKTWLVSEWLLNALDYYDQTSNVQGVKFSLQVNACLFGISSSPELKAILDDWWATSEIKRDNLCWRSYLYNNNITIDDVNQYIQLQDSITIDDDLSKHDLIGKTSTIIDLLDKITGHLDATHAAADAWARSGLPIAFLSISLSDLLRRFLQTVNIGVAQTLHNRLGNLILTHISHEARTLYHLGFNINGSSFSANPSRAAPQIVNVARQNYQNADLVNSRIAMIALIFNGLPMLLKLFRDKPLDEREKTELVASAIGTIAAGFQVGLSYVEATIGNQSNSRTAIVVSNGFGRLFLWAASLSSIAGSMSAVFDVIDMKKEFDKDNSIVAMGYLVRAVATLTLSVSQFLVAMGTINPWLTRILATSTRRTIWTRFIAFGAWLGRIALTRGVAAVLAIINVYATLIIIVVSVVIMIFDDNALQKWFDRCCFSKQTDRDAFDDLTEELTEFHIAIKECF